MADGKNCLHPGRISRKGGEDIIVRRDVENKVI